MNESQEHWRLKRLCRYIAWAMGCWASAPEFVLTAGFAENGERNTVDFLAIGKVRSVQEDILPGEPGHWDTQRFPFATNRRSHHYLGVIAYECKASLSDLRAGMVTAGAHKHYVVVPESLRSDALKLVPKHVGVIVVGERGHWNNSIARGARRRDGAMVPMWCYTKAPHPPAEWTRLLLGMASSNTNYAVRWQT